MSQWNYVCPKCGRATPGWEKCRWCGELHPDRRCCNNCSIGVLGGDGLILCDESLHELTDLCKKYRSLYPHWKRRCPE